MVVHENSAEAFHSLEDFLTGRRLQVYNWVLANGQATDRQIKTGLGFEDMNQVRPRISELVEFGAFKEVGRILDKKTNCRVRIVAIDND